MLLLHYTFQEMDRLLYIKKNKVLLLHLIRALFSPSHTVCNVLCFFEQYNVLY
jgi:hypothetical protein